MFSFHHNIILLLTLPLERLSRHRGPLFKPTDLFSFTSFIHAVQKSEMTNYDLHSIIIYRERENYVCVCVCEEECFHVVCAVVKLELDT